VTLSASTIKTVREFPNATKEREDDRRKTKASNKVRTKEIKKREKKKMEVNTNIKPNVAFQVWTCDEVAECMEGVPNELYKVLWGKGLKEGDKLFGYNPSVSEVWHVFTEDEQTQLNKIAEEQK